MKRLLNLEVLEAKDTPSAITIEGSALRIDGSAYNDTVRVTFDDRGTWWTPFDDQLNVSLTNNGGETLQSTVSVYSVNLIKFFGGDGNDKFTNISGHSAEAYGGTGNDTLQGGSSWDSLYGEEGSDKLYGVSGNDNLYGGNGYDHLDGGNDNDYLSGDAGNDTLLGGLGTDLLTGGEGDDNVNGDTASNYYARRSDGATDTLYGDSGNDTFVQYHRRNWWGEVIDEDRLMDVGNGVDTIVHVNVP